MSAQDAAYWTLVARTRQALLAGEFSKVAAVEAAMPEAVQDALATLTPAQLQEVAARAS